MSSSRKFDEMFAKEEIDFSSLIPIRKPLKIGNEKYLLCEADGEAVRVYKNLSMKAARFGSEGKLESLDGVADVETQLVGDCVYDILPNGERGRKQGVQFAKKLDNRILKPLFDYIKKISEIDEDVETKEFLEKRIKEDTEKLEKLEKENPLKNGQTPMLATSSSE